ncbi:hypothetical protein N5V81_21615 [Escherichia coli]|nr:hypothetical protein [Escherichia coli]
MDNLTSVNVEIVKLKFLGFRDPDSLTAILMDTHFTPGEEYTAFRYIHGDHESAYSVNTNLGEGYFIKDITDHLWGMWELVEEENKSLPKEIWVHTFHTGKFGGTEHKSIHYEEESAIKQQAVLGGSVEKFVKCGD